MKKIFIAGGGTGGHIYPGVAIAKAIQKLNSEYEIHFVGTLSGLETKIIPKENFPLHFISVGKLNVSGIFSKLKTLILLPYAFIQSLALLFKHRPQFVLGVGGYASGPFVLMASFIGIPTAVWEPNAHPGMANRLLSQFVDCCYVVFDGTEKYLKNKNIFQFGMPVRSEIEALAKQERSEKEFHVLVFGGSQGSRIINSNVSDMVLNKQDNFADVKIVHQTGIHDFVDLKKKYEKNKQVEVKEYIYDMPSYYRWADLVICRGGASTLAEVAAFGVVPLIIPLPAADNHQEKNALSIVNAEAGVMILQKDLTWQKLFEHFDKFKSNPQQIKQMSERLKKFYRPQASEKIALNILERINQ